MYEANRATKTFILSAVAISLAVWNIAFNLGVYGTIFFDKVFAVWVASLAILLASLSLSSVHRPVSGWRLLILTTPTLWIVIAIVGQLRTAWTWVDNLAFVLATGVVLLCLPYVGYILISITQSEALRIRPRRLFFALVGIACLIGLLGYFVGANHWLLLSCEDFKMSGNDVPANCWQGNAWR